MKKLTDVYIKATKGNVKELNVLLKKHIKENDCLLFEGDYIETLYTGIPNKQKKITLAELKRLIDTIPTREEIRRLKAQVNYYKVNYKKDIQEGNERANRISNHARELEEIRDKWISLGEKLTAENDNLKHRLIKLRELNDVIYKDVNRLTIENEQLKNRKFWQIWKY